MRKFEAFIDSGAEFCYASTGLAQLLGIKDFKKGFQVPIQGIAATTTAYFHDVELTIFQDPKKLEARASWQYKTKIGFIEPLKVAMLLGWAGFLDQFALTFNLPHNCIELEGLFDAT